MQTLTITLQMHGVVTEHTLIVKALVALAVTAVQASAGIPRLRRAIPMRSPA
jgi:simple sugar transport system permease protein